MPTYTTYATPRLDLGQAFMEYSAAQVGFIADDVLPVIGTQVKAGTFSKITRESLLRNPAIKRSTKSNYARDDYQAEDDTFACEEYGIEIPVGDDEKSRFMNDFDAGMQAMETAAMRVKIAREIRVATAIFNATTWTGATLTTAVSTEWSTTATSTPIQDVENAKIKVFNLTGIMPDTLVINETVLANLLSNASILARIQYAQVASRDVVLNAMANIFGLRQVLVGGGVYNSAKEGQTASISQIWSSEYAMVMKAPTGGGLVQPCVGRSFLWTPDSGSVAVAEVYREEQTRSDVYRVRQHIDEKVFDASFGHLLSNITA